LEGEGEVFAVYLLVFFILSDCRDGRREVHLPHELDLRLWPEVAVHGGLDFEEVLDYVFEFVCPVSVTLSPYDRRGWAHARRYSGPQAPLCS
jgi:hypothetical protein